MNGFESERRLPRTAGAVRRAYRSSRVSRGGLTLGLPYPVREPGTTAMGLRYRQL